YGISNCRRALPTALSQFRRDIGARPVLDPSEVSKISLKEKGFINGCRVVEWGEYPQSITDEYTNKRLEELYSSSSLCSTGKNYTFDGVHPWQIAPPFEAESYPEYKLDDKRYIRIIPKGVTGGAGVFPTTGERFEKKPYWVQVEPVEWLMDDPTGIMVAKKCLFAGIQFNPEKIYRADLSTSFMQVYLDTYFSKEIEPKEPERTKELSKDFDPATLRMAKLRSGRGI
ncbi:MAG: hypothetical protein J6U64_02290, partial [Alphaproteobacteria bacterium]|nr:hypothetical protein [Alphaproteobacteria bacterium]